MCASRLLKPNVQVNWNLEATVEPNSTLSWDNVTDECWATDAATVNGTTFFFLSVGPMQIGVVASPSGPIGPFVDPLGAPLIPQVCFLVLTRGH